MIFSDAQRNVARAILGRIIPAEGQRPAAGDLTQLSAIELLLGPNVPLRRTFLDWLFEVDAASWQDHDLAFVDLGEAEQDDVLMSFEVSKPEFFDVVVRLVYRTYYENPRVLLLLGLDPRPPQPRGFRLAAFDASQLDPVRDRGKLFRDAPP